MVKGAHFRLLWDSLLSIVVVGGQQVAISKERHLLTCYCKHGMIEEVKKVYGGLEGNGCAPNAANFQTFLQYLYRNGDFDMGFEVFKESVRRDKIPDFETMKHLLEGLVKNSKLKEAKRLIKTVNRKFPTTFLNAWKKLEMELGLTSTQEPTVWCYCYCLNIGILLLFGV
ncbi:hypothetical protein HHK36_019936 [Tetracentron sinense]|uniref:Pentatricopeptide repeat-containing protein n=1 Tax=Tetracentron sinense TaxID=13715 RepID=A0A835D7K7_TETSI|nr:hypothetical protein HHK36_019936 [Tetracentron sinense]